MDSHQLLFYELKRSSLDGAVRAIDRTPVDNTDRYFPLLGC